MKRRIHIGIAEDHLLVRQGLVSLLSNYQEINILFDVSNGRELMNELKYSKPDIILLDIEMPVMNGREALERIKVKYPKIGVIIISMHFQDSYIVEFIKKGAGGFLPKNCDVEKIVDTIRAVHEKGRFYDDKVAAIMSKVFSNPSEDSIAPPELPAMNITGREVEILRLLCANKNNREISDHLRLSVRTVEGHRFSIMKKVNCKTIPELTAFALKNNLISFS